MNSNSSSSIEKCVCDETEASQESDLNAADSPPSKDKKPKLSLSSLGLNLRRGRSLHFSKRTKKNQDSVSTSETPSSSNSSNSLNSAIKKLPKWGLKFNCAKKVSKSLLNAANQNCCKCTCYKKKDEGVSSDSGDGAVGNGEEIEGASDENDVVEEQDAAVGGEKSEDIVQVKDNDVDQQEEANVGIYGTNFLSLPPPVFSGQFLNVHW